MPSLPRLTRRLVLERPRRIADGGGGAEIAWEPVGTLWAELRPVSAAEPSEGNRQTATVSHRVTLRTAPPGSPRHPRADQRFRSGRRVFNIVGVAQSERPAYLTCWVEESPFQ